MNIENLVIELSKDPFNPDLNFDLAEAYLSLNQSASAISFYLRCAEYSDKANIKAYASLIRMAQCFEDQTGREYSVSNCLLQALAYDDSRPEAYFKLSQYYERTGSWQEAYTFAVLGLGWAEIDEKLPADVGYYGAYCLAFQQFVAAWWIGRKDESIEGLRQLKKQKMHAVYKKAVNDNLVKLNALL
jgi:tetratricopeptide (TPR) repeat protein